MEIIVILILTILILLSSRMRQNTKARQREDRLGKTVMRLQEKILTLEGSGKVVLNQRESAQRYTKEPPRLSKSDLYWTRLSRWYRAELNWKCEECQIDLSQKRYFLHVHHVKGRGWNSLEDLKALCVGCHAKQTEPEDHSFMKNDEQYQDFLTEAGVGWRRLRQRYEKGGLN